jgi:hypothetical protein
MAKLTVCGASAEATNWPRCLGVADHLTEHFIDEYVLHRLNPAEVDLVEEHLLGCDVCIQEVEQTLLVIEMMRLHSIDEDSGILASTIGSRS